MNLWKTPTGKDRSNNPFGFREQEVLSTFDHFTFDGFIDAGNRHFTFYVPLYWVQGKDFGFEYYYYAGKVNIIG